ncbi:long-chain fatty acid--CoA ligase [Laceyella sacchari]|nr:long-chain fatty acid--CoA ligase [Laceyella sacchari]
MADTEKVWLKHYPPQVPHHLNYPDVPLTQFLVDAARDYPERDAIFFLGKRMTYRQVLEDSYRLAHALKSLGISRGERIGIMLPNSPQAVIAYYAALFAGGIVVQFNPLYMKRELEHQLNDAEVETLICLDMVYPRVSEVKAQTKLKHTIVTSIYDYLPFPKNWLFQLKSRFDNTHVEIPEAPGVFKLKKIMSQAPSSPVETPYDSGDDVALLQYTGGTTGLAKGAMLTHRNLVVNCCQAEAWMYQAQRGADTILGALPFFHVYGMTVVMNFAVRLAATMILVPKFDRDLILKLITEHRPSYFPGAPTMYVGLINHPDIKKYDLSSINACLSGSAPLPIEVQEQFEALTGGLLIEGYGMTESSPVTHANLIWERTKSGTIGVPWPDTEARIVDLETGEVLPPGQAGELQVKGPQVMKGYWKRPEETAKVLVDGWLCTGDIAKMDEDGYFYIIDRKKDMIIAGGFNIYPREVEEVLFEHPAIQEAVVVGVPDPYRGETVKAYIVLKEGMQLSEKELEKFCRERLASYKIPRLVEFRKELPKSTIGKVLRRVLLDEEMQKNKNEGAL